MSLRVAGNRSPAAGLVLAVSLHAFEQMAIVAIMEPMIAELGGRGVTGLVFGAYLIASILSTVWSGGFIDRHGPYFPMMGGLVCFAGGLLLAAGANSVFVLIVARIVQGLGGGSLQTVSFAVVNRAFEEDRRPGVLAALSQAWVLPGILGPPIAGALEQFIHWRFVFLVTVPLVPVAAWLLLPPLRAMQVETRRASGEGRSGALGFAFVLALGTGLVLAGGVQANLLPALTMVLGGLALTWFALRRLFPAGVFALRPILPAAVGLKFLVFFAFFGPDAYIAMALVETRGQSVLQASLALIPAALCWALASSVAARMKGPDYLHLARRGMGLLALGIALLIAVMHHAVSPYLVFAAWGLAGFGVGFAYIALMALAMKEAPPDREGEVGMAMTISDSLGFALGAGFVGSMLFHFAHAPRALQFGGAWSISLAVALLAALFAYRLRR